MYAFGASRESSGAERKRLLNPGEWRERTPDFVLAQEANSSSMDRLCGEAGFDWVVMGAGPSGLRPPAPGDRTVRQRGSAILGRGAEPRQRSILEDAPLPERAVLAVVDAGGRPVTVASYHAPPGVN